MSSAAHQDAVQGLEVLGQLVELFEGEALKRHRAWLEVEFERKLASATANSKAAAADEYVKRKHRLDRLISQASLGRGQLPADVSKELRPLKHASAVLTCALFESYCEEVARLFLTALLNAGDAVILAASLPNITPPKAPQMTIDLANPKPGVRNRIQMIGDYNDGRLDLGNPNARTVDRFFSRAVGFPKDMHERWFWAGASANQVKVRLQAVVSARNASAHTGVAAPRLSLIRQRIDLVQRLVDKTDAALHARLLTVGGKGW